jgi:glutaredoxin 3
MRPSAGRPSGSGPRRPSSQRPQCWEHGLATGPDGLCTLCKRSSRPAPVPGDTVSPITRFMTSVGSVLGIAAVGVALAAAFGLVELDLLLPDWLRSEPNIEAKREPVVVAPAPAPPVAQKTPAQLAAEQLAQQIAQQEQQLAAATASAEALEPNVQAALTAEEQAEVEKRDRERREEIASDMEARALKRAREKVRVVMYSTTWCPSCVSARKYMTENAIPFTDHDIDESPSARAIQRRLNPKGSIPTIDVEGAVLVGFSGESLEQMIDAAAKKRVR